MGLGVFRRIEELAEFSVARGCGFAALAIVTFTVALSGQMAVAFRAAGFLSLLMCMTLLLKAWNAPHHPYKRTELWLLLMPPERPNAEIAQRIISNALREAYLRFAMHSAWAAALFLSAAIVWGFVLPG